MAKVRGDDDFFETLRLRKGELRCRCRNGSERREARGTKRHARISSTSETRFN
jgi:hypothetical protein